MTKVFYGRWPMRSIYLAGWASWLLTNDRILLWLLANEKPLPGRMGILAADHRGNAGLLGVPCRRMGDVSAQKDDRFAENLQKKIKNVKTGAAGQATKLLIGFRSIQVPTGN
jgi:hypothetical protein